MLRRPGPEWGGRGGGVGRGHARKRRAARLARGAGIARQDVVDQSAPAVRKGDGRGRAGASERASESESMRVDGRGITPEQGGAIGRGGGG